MNESRSLLEKIDVFLPGQGETLTDQVQPGLDRFAGLIRHHA
jgi:hypothetical protein